MVGVRAELAGDHDVVVVRTSVVKGSSSCGDAEDSGGEEKMSRIMESKLNAAEET